MEHNKQLGWTRGWNELYKLSRLDTMQDEPHVFAQRIIDSLSETSIDTDTITARPISSASHYKTVVSAESDNGTWFYAVTHDFALQSNYIDYFEDVVAELEERYDVDYTPKIEYKPDIDEVPPK